MITQMAWRDVGAQHKQSRLGLFWLFAEPAATVAVLYLVFGIGFKAGDAKLMPFLPFLVIGMAVLNLFNESVSSGTQVIRKHSYLLTKIQIELNILPLSTVLASLVNHLIYAAAAIIILLINGIYPTWYWLQIVYYWFALMCLVLGIVWFTSSVSVFFHDLHNLIGIGLRLLFYFTPIFWSPEILPLEWQEIIKLNPLYYIVTGYRESFASTVAFWEHYKQALYFWSWVGIMLFLGNYIFKKLRPEFADYL